MGNKRIDYLHTSITTYKKPSPHDGIYFLEQAWKTILSKSKLSSSRIEYTLLARHDDKYRKKPIHSVDWQTFFEPLDGLNRMVLQGVDSEWDRDASDSLLVALIVDISEPILAHQLNCHISQRVFGWEIEPDVQEAMTNLMLSAISKTDAISAYMTLDQVPAYGPSPYELYLRYGYENVAADFDKQVRGYYWGTYLHNKHIELLGGHHILDSYPFFIKRPFHNGCYIQLTNDINHIDRQELKRLEQLVKPLLPPKRFPGVNLDKNEFVL